MEKDSRTFLEKITTIHGTNNFQAKFAQSKVLWWLAMVMTFLATITFISIIQQKLRNDQIYTKIDSTCHVNQVPFPAVSICNMNTVSKKESANIARLLKKHNRTDSEIDKFFENLPKLRYNTTPDADNSTEIMEILKSYSYSMDTIMEEVYQKCENLLLYCEFNRRKKNCIDVFSLIKTVEGHCCAFNYAALNDVSEVFLPPHDDSLEYYDGDEDTDHVSGTIIATSESGRLSGLTVVLNVEPNDYPHWTQALNYGAMVTLDHTDRYSYETCVTECTMASYMHSCGCTPYKYPRDESRRFCELTDLPCMYNLTVYGQSLPCNPPCYVECRDKGYVVGKNTLPFFATDYPHDVTNGHDINHLAAIKVYFTKSTCNCYKLTLLMDVNYFIATYGGVLGLSFGASILTAVELIYLIISRLYGKISRNIHCWRQW